MANSKAITRKRKRVLTRVIFIAILLGVFGLGRVTTPAKVQVKTKTVVKTEKVEVPVEKDELPDVKNIKYLDIPLSHSLQEYITELCADENIPVSLIYALIEQESGFNPEVVSKTDDYGLMQINKLNHDRLTKKYKTVDFLNPYQNVYCGVKTIGTLVKDNDGDYGKALMSYNLGSYGAKKCWAQGITSTKYSRSILSLMQKYEKELSDDK